MIDIFATEPAIKAYFGGGNDHPVATEEFLAFWDGLSWTQKYNFKFNVWNKMSEEEKARWSSEWAGLNKRAREMFIETRLGKS